MEVASAFVSLLPSARGFGRRLDSQIGREVDKSGKAAGGRFGGALKASAGLALGAGAAIGAASFMKSAVGLEAQFGKTMNVLQATTDAPAKTMKQLSDLAMKMGADTVFSASDASKAMLELARGGMSAATIQGGALKGTMTLAAAGELEMGEAANIAVKSMGQFHLRGKDMGSVAAALAGAANASSASVRDLSIALAQGGLAANSVGFSIQETTGILAAFSNAGLEGSDAGTSLKTMLDRLTPSTQGQVDAFMDLGVITKDGRNQFIKANGEFKSAAEIAELLHKGTEKLNQSERKRLITQAFGSDAQRAATILASQGAKGIDKMTKATSDQGAANKVAAANMKGTAGALEAMKGSIETATLAFGQAIEPVVVFAAGVVTNIANGAVPIIQNLSTMLGNIGKNLNLGPVLQKITDTFKLIAGNVVNAFKAIEPGLADFGRNIINAFKDVAPKIVAAFQNLAPQVHAVAQKVVDAFKAAVPHVIAAFQDVTPKIVAAFHGIAGKVTRTLGRIDISGLATDLAAQAKGWATPIIDGFKAGLDSGDWSGLGSALGRGLVGAIKGLGILSGKIATALSDLLGKAFGATLAKIDWVGIGIGIGKQVPSLLVGLAAGILNFDLFGLLKGLAAHWQDILFAIIAVAFTPAKIVGKVGEVLARIPLVGKMLEWALLHFKKFSDGLVKMVGRALGFLGKAFMTGFRRVFPAVGKRFADALSLLPTRLALLRLEVAERALKMVRGIGGGIAKGIGSVVAKIGELVARMLKPFANAGGWLVRKGVALIGGLLRGIGSALAPVWRLISGLGGRIVRALGDLGSLLKDAGKKVIQGLIDGIKSMIGKVGGAMGSVASKIKGFLPGSPVREGPLTSWNRGAAGQRLVGLLADGLSDTSAVDKAMTHLSSRVAVKSPSISAGVTSGTAAGGRGGQEIRGTLGIDRDGVAYIHGVSRTEVHFHAAAREAADRAAAMSL